MRQRDYSHKFHHTIRWSIGILSALVLIVVFQNCSVGLSVGESSPQALETLEIAAPNPTTLSGGLSEGSAESGNGQGYDGKLTTYYSYGFCDGVPKEKRASIELSVEARVAKLSRKDCKPVEPMVSLDFETVIISEDQREAFYLGRTYYRYDVLPPVASEVLEVGAAVTFPKGGTSYLTANAGQVAMFVDGTDKGVFYYDTESNRWQTRQPTGDLDLPFIGVDGFRWFGDRLLMLGGDGTMPFSFRGFFYDAPTNRFTKIDSSGVHPAGSGYSVGKAGDSILLFGGVGGMNLFAETTLYHPDKNKWESLGNPLGLSVRIAWKALWTGKETVVFGGEGWQNQKFNDGYIFNPVTKAFRKLPTLNAPSPRLTTIAESVGEKLIYIHGEGPQNEYYKDSYMLDVASNSWSKIADFPNEYPGQNAVILSTGSRLIYLNYQYSATDRLYKVVGFAFDPGSNTWESLKFSSLLGFKDYPSAIKAVWTDQGIFLVTVLSGDVMKAWLLN